MLTCTLHIICIEFSMASPRSTFLSCPGRNQAPAHAHAWLCTPHLFLIMYKRPRPGICRHPGAHETPSTRVQH